MYAIVEIAGQQFKVAQDQKVYVHRLQGEEGATVSFNKVLLLDNKGAVTIGAPAIQGAEVTAKILGHLQGDKVIVFKKKRRKGYKKKNGHRQALTEIQVESIVASGAKKSVPAKKEEAKADDLKKIEGIGPKIADIFAVAGIDTFAKLAVADVETLKEILVAAGSRYASKNPGSWPKQAKMATEGKWDELKVWQDNTKGGIE